MSRFDFGPSESSGDVSNFLTKPQADTLYHNENNDINMNNHKITNLKDGVDNSDGVNKKQLDDKVDLLLFAKLSTDVQWLNDNHVSPSQYRTVLIELGEKAEKSGYNALLGRIVQNELKVNRLPTYTSEIKTLTVTADAYDHLLFDLPKDTIIEVKGFYFETSTRTDDWHDLSTKTIKDILGQPIIRHTIVGDKKQILLHTTVNDWWRKHVFTNYYSFRYKIEYSTVQPLLLNDGSVSSN